VWELSKLDSRIKALEAQRATDEQTETGDDSRTVFLKSLEAISMTMDAAEFSEVFREILDCLNSDDPLDFRLSFVAAHVHSLATHDAYFKAGKADGLLMPPALSAAWRDLERRYADAPFEEKREASFWCQVCEFCGARHPFFGRHEFDEKYGYCKVLNQDEILTICLVCSNELTTRETYRPTW
jgi:hypothetical protein